MFSLQVFVIFLLYSVSLVLSTFLYKVINVSPFLWVLWNKRSIIIYFLKFWAASRYHSRCQPFESMVLATKGGFIKTIKSSTWTQQGRPECLNYRGVPITVRKMNLLTLLQWVSNSFCIPACITSSEFLTTTSQVFSQTEKSFSEYNCFKKHTYVYQMQENWTGRKLVISSLVNSLLMMYAGMQRWIWKLQ